MREIMTEHTQVFKKPILEGKKKTHTTYFSNLRQHFPQFDSNACQSVAVSL